MKKPFKRAPCRNAPEYRAWEQMKRRCYDTNHAAYKYYGAKGIRVCAEWMTDYPAFLAHIGKRPSDLHSLDRINSRANYEPGNVRWSTMVEQQRNRSNVVWVTYKGRTQCLTEWGAELGMHHQTLRRRIKVHGLEYAMTAPLFTRRENQNRVRVGTSATTIWRRKKDAEKLSRGER